MPTRKQRRRRDKVRRHEYEYVYVDGEGREVEVAETAERNMTRNDGAKGVAGKATTASKTAGGKTAAGARDARPPRAVKPPSWNRTLKRAPIFLVLIVVVTGIGKHAPPIGTRLALAVLYAALLVPFMYFFDSAMYRSYRKRIGDPLPPRTRQRGSRS